MKKTLYASLAAIMLAMPANCLATKFLGVKVIDKDYLMLHFRDGEVHYRDNGTGPSAYLGHSFAEGNDTLLVFGERLKATQAQNAGLFATMVPQAPILVRHLSTAPRLGRLVITEVMPV